MALSSVSDWLNLVFYICKFHDVFCRTFAWKEESCDSVNAYLFVFILWMYNKAHNFCRSFRKELVLFSLGTRH